MIIEFSLDELRPSCIDGIDFSQLPAERVLGPGTYDFSNMYCAIDKSSQHIYFHLGAIKDLREYIAFYYVLISKKKPIMIYFFGGDIRILSNETPTRSNNFAQSRPNESTEAIIKSASAVLHTLKGGMKGAFRQSK